MYDLIGSPKPVSGLSAEDSQNLEIAMLKVAYDKQYRGMAFTGLAVVLSLIAWLTALRQPPLLIWIALIGLTGIWGTAETYIFKRTTLGAHNLQFWQRLYFGRSIVTGLAWGSEASLLASGPSGWDTAVLIATYLCLYCVVIDILMAQWRALAALLLCSSAFLVFQLLRDPQPHATMLAIISITTVLLCALVGWSLNRNLRSLLETQLGLRKAKREAETANRHKSQFLSNMSHEIRTPMNAVLGMIQLLNYTQLSERQLDYVQKTGMAATSLLELLNNILDFSKIEAGKMELENQPFRLETLLQDLEAMLITNTVGKPVSSQLLVDAGIPEVLVGDVMRLRQVLTNLVSNAMKFTERGEVSVSVSLRSKKPDAVQLRFSVRDTGIGIAPENQKLVFEEFTQAETLTTRRFGGTGLGLSISKQLINMMGGTLQLQSALGQGSHFFFDLVLPVARVDALYPIPTALKSAPSARLQGLRLLLVEDNLLNRQVAMELLQEEGAHVTLADHGAQALEVLRQSREAIDVVLMDIQMPVMDGYTATRAIRCELGLKNLPIIAMTANAMVSDRATCLAAGMNDHVPKPIHVDHLVRTIVQCRTMGNHANPD